MYRPIRVSSECREKIGLLSQILKRVDKSYEIDLENPEIIVPCDLLDEDAAEALIRVYLKSQPPSTESIIIAVDPGEAKAGVVIAVGQEITYIGSTTPSTFKKILLALSKHYAKILVFAGNTPPARKLLDQKPENVDVELLDESTLPTIHFNASTRDDALDALRIYLKGRALILKKAIVGSSF